MTERASRLVLALFGLAAVAVVLVVAESLARRLAPGYLVEKRGLHVSSTTLGWKGRPGAVAPMGGGKATLNAHGYRGRPPDSPRDGGRERVVVLGDSIAFGYGVADEEAFPHLLDARDNGLEAVNLGVQGYGPGQELLVLRGEGLAARPDVVVLAFCLRNDFVDAVLPVALYDGVTPRPRFALRDGRLALDAAARRRGPAARAVQWLADYSHLWNRLARPLTRPPGSEERDWRHRKQEALRDEGPVLELTLALVREMERVCRERGVRFLVATFPSGLGHETVPPLHERFRRSLEEDGTRVVDMALEFRQRGLSPDEVALDRTGHLSARGHAVAAEALERELGPRS